MGRRADRQGEHRTAFDKNKKIVLARGGCCGICGQPIDMTLKYPHPLAASVDHIIPIHKGGHPSALSNLQIAHWVCNRQKSDKLVQRVQAKSPDEVISNRDLLQSMDWTTYKVVK